MLTIAKDLESSYFQMKACDDQMDEDSSPHIVDVALKVPTSTVYTEKPFPPTQPTCMQETTLDMFPDLEGWVDTGLERRKQFLDQSYMANQLCKPRGGKRSSKKAFGHHGDE